jgi:hypothetical protein
MFKHVMYLAKGEIVYCGPPKNSIQAFEQVSGNSVRGNEIQTPPLHFTPCSKRGIITAPHAGNRA